jgi:4-diphosphocytidyl-2-C-methyl-D-erythritol kinase
MITTNSVSMRSAAKLNIHLEVLREREDGFHEIETIMQTVKLFDYLDITLTDRDSGIVDVGITVFPDNSAPADETNLCCKAAQLFLKKTKKSGVLSIDLKKNIPAEAGLGGGSGNAAAVLVACNRLFKTGLSNPELEDMASELGSDIPFFISGGTQLARGVGCDLTPLHPIDDCLFLIMKPEVEISTTEVYSALNMGLTVRAPLVNIRNVKALLTRFPSSSWFGINRLEDVVIPRNTVLQDQLFELRENEPVVMMTGSGSTLFAAYKDKGHLNEYIEESLNDSWFIAEVSPHNSGVEFMEV